MWVQLCRAAERTERIGLGPGVPWSYVASYVKTVKALLAGDEVAWDGAVIQMIHPSVCDRPFITGELLAGGGAALSPKGLRERLAAAEAGGATEVAYQPAGPDIARELEAFAKAAQG